jgi:hypothetical protein
MHTYICISSTKYKVKTTFNFMIDSNRNPKHKKNAVSEVSRWIFFKVRQP